MPRGFIDIRGLGPNDPKVKRLHKQLKRLDLRDQKKVIRKSMRKTIKIALNKMKARVPVKTGALKRSLKVRSEKTKRRSKFIGVYIRTGTREELGIDRDSPSYYPAHVELGTKNDRPSPWMRSSFKESSSRMIEDFKERLREEIINIAKKTR